MSDVQIHCGKVKIVSGTVAIGDCQECSNCAGSFCCNNESTCPQRTCACCTPASVSVVLSGIDAGICTDCCNPGTGTSCKMESLAVDGTYCLDETDKTSDCAWQITIPNAVTHKEFTHGTSQSICDETDPNVTSTCVVTCDALLKVRIGNGPSVDVDILVTNCTGCSGNNQCTTGTPFDTNSVSITHCDEDPSNMTNTQTCGCPGANPLDTGSDAGTASLSWCCT